jgi:hypothetical protein
MSVELLQKSTAQGAFDRAARSLSASASTTPTTHELSLSKSTLAVSEGHTGKSKAFMRFFLPVLTESEFGERPLEFDGFMAAVNSAIHHGAARPDDGQGSSFRFDNLSTMRTCGQDSRLRFEKEVPGMIPFDLHGVYAKGAGIGHQGSHREVGGLTVSEVEQVFQKELGDLSEFSPWMDVSSAAFWHRDLDSYVQRFTKYGAAFLALRWPSADGGQQFYSLITHVPNTQEVFEIISANAPSDPSLVVKDFPLPRHVFVDQEVEWLMSRPEAVQLHVSRTHRDLDVIKAHYKEFLDLDPMSEMRDASTGVGFVSFDHQQNVVLPDSVRAQVMYWNTPDQSMTKVHTTDWLEEKLENINAKYMKSYTGCWPVWGDNHYTITGMSGDDFQSVQDKYNEHGIGFMLFNKRNPDTLTGGYFPMPGGFYLEIKPVAYSLPPVADAYDFHIELDSTYCFEFACPP